MNDESPTWLKIMQNGTIGEARSRAFLLDRFWVLERSVDIDGADFIIQRRLLLQNLLDREAPRLGVVQVKFYGTQQTSHYVHKEYVVDKVGAPRTEFFLLCHSGAEEDQRVFLLTAKEIVDSFALNEEGTKYYLPWNKVAANGTFEVRSKKLALDRIEDHLKLADFAANRRFMSWVLPSTVNDADGILPEYKLPIDNYYGSIPDCFRDLKDVARGAMFDVEEIFNFLRKIADTHDPLEAVSVLKQMEKFFGSFRRWRFSLPDELRNEDFENVCAQHHLMVSAMKGDGVLDNFIQMRAHVKTEFMSFLKPHYPVDRNLVNAFKIHYDPQNLTFQRVESKLESADDFMGAAALRDSNGLVTVPTKWPDPDLTEETPGCVSGFWMPGRLAYGKYNEVPTLDGFERYDFQIYTDIMSFIYKLKYHSMV